VPADKGFAAYVDGKETSIYRVNLGLSAVLVPQGEHEVSFVFVPKGLKTGMGISSVMLLVLLMLGWRENVNHSE